MATFELTSRDFYLLAPELSIAGVAVLVIVLDLLFRRKDILPWASVLGLAVPLAFSVALWLDLGDGTSAERMSGLFGVLVVDKFSLFFKFLLVAAAALVVLVSCDYVRRFQRFQGEYYALVLLSTSGMMLLASTVELITIYVALELTALPIAALAAFARDSRSSESGVKFLVLSAVSSAVLLYGMVLVYGFTGTTSIAGIAAQVAAGGPGNALLFGVVLMVAGFGFKIASVPFQMWAPDVYEGSPTPVTAFLSVASKAAGFAVILRVFYVAFADESLNLEWGAIFAMLSVLSMTFGNLVAIRQSNIKRLLAYSTIAHAGYMMVGLAAVAARTADGESVGATGVIFYLAGYAATNLAAFAVVIAITSRVGGDEIKDFAGMARRTPYLAAALGFALISLIGVPPTVGFIAKVYIFGAAVGADLEWLAVAGVVNSVLSAYYYLRIVKEMYLSEPASDERVPSGLPMRLAVLAAFAGVLVFGVYPTPLLELSRAAAAVLVS